MTTAEWIAALAVIGALLGMFYQAGRMTSKTDALYDLCLRNFGKLGMGWINMRTRLGRLETKVFGAIHPTCGEDDVEPEELQIPK